MVSQSMTAKLEVLLGHDGPGFLSTHTSFMYIGFIQYFEVVHEAVGAAFSIRQFK